MPQLADSLPDLIDNDHLSALRALFVDYKVTMISCQYWRNGAPWSVPWRTCPDSFFLVPVRGQVRVSLSSGPIIIKPGEFLMLPEGTRHALELPEEFERLEQIALHCHIHDRWARPLLGRFPGSRGKLPGRTFWWRKLMELTCLRVREPGTFQLRGEAAVRELLAWQLSSGNRLARATPAGDPRVGVVLETMERRCGSAALSVEGLAGIVGITPVQLRKLFRRETSTSPKRFLNTLRLRRATHLLRGTTASIKEVAAACGFASDHYFHLAFRAAFRCTPSEYRRDFTIEV